MLETEFDKSVNERVIEILDDVYVSLVLSRTDESSLNVFVYSSFIVTRHNELRREM